MKNTCPLWFFSPCRKRAKTSAEQPVQRHDEVNFPVHSLSGQVLLTTAKPYWHMQDLHQSLLTSLRCSYPEIYDVRLLLGERHLSNQETVGEIVLSPGEAVQAVTQISSVKYAEKVKAAIRRIPLIMYSTCVPENFDLEALLRLVCMAKDFASDEDLPAVLPEEPDRTIVKRSVSVSLAHYMNNIWCERGAHEKLVEYALALELLEQWESLFKDLSVSVRHSSLIAHQQIAPRIGQESGLCRLFVVWKILRSDSQSCVQQAAWDNLAAILPLMEAFPGDAVKFLRCLESEKDEGRIAVFEACLHSKAPPTRIAALAALGSLAGEQYDDILNAMSQPETEPVAIVRRAAKRALEHSRPCSADQLCLVHTRSADSVVSLWTYQAR